MNKFLVIFLSLLYCTCLAPIIYYSYLYFTAPDKVVNQTYEVGAQTVTTIDGSKDTRYFCELNLFDDCFEIKFNYMLDESKNSFYSQGIQIVPKTEKFDFNGKYDIREDSYKYHGYSEFCRDSYTQKEWFAFAHANGIHTIYDLVVTGKEYDNLNIYNYASMNNFETTINDTNEITLNTSFRLELDNELYLMKFNGDKAVKNKDSVEMKKFLLMEDEQLQHEEKHYWLAYTNVYINHYNIYRASDITYFLELLYNSVQTLKKGTEQTIVFQFGDLFDYYEYDEDKKTYSEKTISSDKWAKVIADIKSYYAIKVNIHEGKIASSKDSLFNYFKGSANYTTGNVTKTDYLYGKTLLKATEDDFEINENNKLELSEKFIKDNEKYISSVELKVVIDEEFLNKTKAVFTKETFKNFKVYKVITTTGKEINYG